MNDADTRIKDLINSAVDRELDAHRSAPPLDLSRLAEQPEPARPHLGASASPAASTSLVARWSVPVLAAAVAALLTVGGMLAIGFERDQQVNPPANSPSPRPWATPSLSRSINPDPAVANRAYVEAAAGAREATEVAGVSIEPLSAKEAVRLKGSGALTADAPIMVPEPGKPYSFTVSYQAGPSDDPPTVLTTEVRDVASGSCAERFLAQPGHTYRIRCQVMLLAGITGKASLTAQEVDGKTIMSINLTDPAKASPGPSSSMSSSPEQEAAARRYSEAVASAPEASKVAGVSDRPATAEELRSGEAMGSLDTPVLQPERGRTYPVTLLYIRSSAGPAISVLAIEFEDVTSGSCPRAFRTRPGHAYVIRCQVVFTDGAVGKAYYRLTEPQVGRTMGKTISTP